MRLLSPVVFLLMLLCGCSPSGQAGTLPTTRIVVDAKSGPATFTVELATDDASRKQGLMYRTGLAPDAGMLFDFHSSNTLVFWMKNTRIPLDMIFIRANGTIANVVTNTIPYSEDRIVSVEPVRAVLEIPAGRSQALGIEAGETVHAKMFGNGP